MKKLLFVLLLISSWSSFSQKIELVNKEYESYGGCMKSFKIRALNMPKDILALSLVLKPKNNLSTARTISAKLIDETSKTFETDIITVGNTVSFNVNFIVFKLVQVPGGIFPIVAPVPLALNASIDICDESQFRFYRLMNRGETLDDVDQTVCNNAQGGVHSVNVTKDVSLEKGKIYRLNYGFGLGYYEVISSDDESNLYSVSKANGLTVTGPFNAICDDDDNGETDPDEVDTSDYDLRLLESNVNVFSACNNCPSQLNLLNPRFLGGAFPVNSHVMSLEKNDVIVNFKVENQGKTNSEATKVNFYLSNVYNSIEGVRANGKTISILSLKSGGFGMYSASFTIDDFKRLSGKYYLVVDVESGENDSNKTNNFINIPIEVKSALRRVPIGNKLPRVSDEFEKSFKESENSSLIKSAEVFNLSGKLLGQTIINNYMFDSVFFNTLPKGIYIVKAGKEVFKIAK